MRKLFAIVAACLMSMGANAACGDNYDELYTNLPFEMNKVTRPQFPDNEVNLRDFGAVGDGSSLCTDAGNLLPLGFGHLLFLQRTPKLTISINGTLTGNSYIGEVVA